MWLDCDVQLCFLVSTTEDAIIWLQCGMQGATVHTTEVFPQDSLLCQRPRLYCQDSTSFFPYSLSQCHGPSLDPCPIFLCFSSLALVFPSCPCQCFDVGVSGSPGTADVHPVISTSTRTPGFPSCMVRLFHHPCDSQIS